MTKYLPFFWDKEKFVTNQKCFIITGKHLGYLTAFLNSSLFKYCYRDSFPELQAGTRELSKIFFDKLAVAEVTDEQDAEFIALVEKNQRIFLNQKLYGVICLSKQLLPKLLAPCLSVLHV